MFTFCAILLCHFVLTHAAYETNPFLAGVPFNYENNKIPPQRNINQWNVAVVVPPGAQLPSNNTATPAPPSPGYFWVQVPISVGINGPAQSTVAPNPSIPGIQQPIPPTTTSTPLSPPSTPGVNLNNKCLSPRGQFPSTACNRFVNCWDGVAVEQSCPPDLLFNSKGYCDYPANVNCNGRPIIDNPPSSGWVTIEPPSTSYPSVAPTLPPSSIPSSTTTLPPTLPPVNSALRKYCLQPRGQFPGSACNKYVNCWDDVVIEQECPEGLLFSKKGYCDFANLVECGSMAPINITGPSKDCPLELGTFRDPKNCAVYHTCVAWKIAATYQCPTGYSFNQDLGVCDFSYRVDCGLNSLNDLHNNLVFVDNNGVPAKDADCPAETGTFRDRNQCNAYYTCVSYKIVARYECPDGYNFNDNIGVCDFAYRVDCTKAPKIYHFRNTFIPQIPPDFMDKIDGCKPGVVFRLNQQCSLACRCREGLVEFIQCPDGLAYDSPTDKCISLDLARC